MGYDKKSKLHLTKSISDRILTLPMYPGLKKEDLEYICEVIQEFAEKEDSLQIQ